MHPDEDLKLELGSRSHARETQTPVVQNQTVDPVGMSIGNTHAGRSSLHVVDDDVGALYLVADAPHSYCEAMGHVDADGWVEAIATEAENLS